MPLVMIDTSVWIEFFRKGKDEKADKLEALLEKDRVALCGIVEMELLRGVRKHERSMLKNLLGSLHYLETNREDFIEAGEKLRSLREHGITIPSTDALIAQICIRNNYPLLTLDRHFDYLDSLRIF